MLIVTSLNLSDNNIICEGAIILADFLKQSASNSKQKSEVVKKSENTSSAIKSNAA